MGIQLGSAYGKVTLDANGVVTGVTTAVNSLEKLKKAGSAVADVLTSSGQAMTAMFTVPLAILGKKSFDTAMDFDKAMNILKGATKATGEQLQQLSDKAKELGADLTLPGTSAADAAEAMAELAKAGLDVNETLAASKGVLQLSAAGQIDNAEAAQISANALNAFNLNASEAVRVADLLAAGANATSADVKEMGYALQMSASVFATAGVKIEDLATAIGLMANKGIQGSDAGTSLKSMLLRLQAPSAKASGEMKDLGIEIYDANGKMKDMRDIVQIFSSKLSGLTQKERDYALATIFGSDAVRSANIVLMGGVDAYDEMKTAVTETGAAAKMAGTMMEGLPGAIENIKSSFETAQIAAIEPFKEDIISISHGIASLFNAFTNLPAPIRKLIVMMLMLLALTGPLLMLAGGMINFAFKIMTLVQALQGLGIVLPSLGAMLSGLPAILSSIGAVITGTVIPALVAMAGTFLTIILPILIIIATLVLLYLAFKNNWFGITTTVKQGWFLIKYYFGEGWKWLMQSAQRGLTAVWEWFKKLGAQIVQAFKSIDWAQVGKMMLWGLANGLLLGIPAAVAAVLKAAKEIKKAFDAQMDMHSPSGEFEKRGENTWLGYMKGLNKMDPSAVSRMMTKPILNQSTSSQTNSTMNFASGLTLRDAERMFSRNNEMIFRKLDSALGGA
jgi:TP901 family phage tail tape measure protein